MDPMSTIPVMPTANPARYIAPTILAVVLYVFVPSAPVGVLEDVFGSASFLSFREHGGVSLLPPMEGQRVIGEVAGPSLAGQQAAVTSLHVASAGHVTKNSYASVRRM